MKNNGLVWSKSLHSIGIESLDEQHEKLVAQVNRLAGAINGSGESPAELMGELVSLAKAHFALEESLMARHDFPGLEGHSREHREMLNRLEVLNELLGHSDPFKAELVLAFCTDWAEFHLLKGEKEMGRYLVERGVH